MEPKGFGVDGDSGIGYGRNFFGAAENVDDADGDGDVFEARIRFLAEDFGFVGIDGDDGVTGGLEVGGDFVGGAARIRGKTDDGDGFGLAEEIGDGVRSGGSVGGEMDLHKALMNWIWKRVTEIGRKWKRYREAKDTNGGRSKDRLIEKPKRAA